MARSTLRGHSSRSSDTSSLDSDISSSEDEKSHIPARPTGQGRRNVVYHSLPVDGGGVAQLSRQALVEDPRKSSAANSPSYPVKRKSRMCIIVVVCVVVASLLVLAGGTAYYYRDRLFGEGTAVSDDDSASTPTKSSQSLTNAHTDSSGSATKDQTNAASASTAIPSSSTPESSAILSTSTASHDSTDPAETPAASSSSIPASPSASSSSSSSSSIDPTQSYTLAKECIGDTFFNCFTSSSTTNAISAGLASVDGSSAYLRLNSWIDLEAGDDRAMVQIESEVSFENALLILDVPKVPFGCGAKSTLAVVSKGSAGLSLPLLDTSTGQSSISLMSTKPGCSLGSKELFTGDVVSKNVDCTAENGSAGCAVLNPSTHSYARPWNEAKGGVFAFLFDKSGLYIWQFTRSALPKELDPPQPSK